MGHLWGGTFSGWYILERTDRVHFKSDYKSLHWNWLYQV